MKPFFKKGNVLYGILKFKCTHCHEGDFFDGFPLKSTVNKSCEVCDRKLSLEPGFYQGSYYVTYALGVAVLVACWLIISVFSLGNVFSFNDFGWPYSNHSLYTNYVSNVKNNLGKYVYGFQAEK